MLSNKLARFTILLMVIALALAGCKAAEPVAETSEPVEETGGQEVEPTEAPEAEEPAVEEEPVAIKMAVLSSGTVDDLSWNYQMQQAMLTVAEERGIEAEMSERVETANAERVMLEYIDRGFNFIVAHSALYAEPVMKVAEDNPDVNFLWAIGQERLLENLSNYNYPFYQPYYLMGILAAGMSETGIVSLTAGIDDPNNVAYINAFKLGAEVMGADLTVLYTTIGSFTDVPKAKEATLAHFDAGADLAMALGFGPALGAIEAAQERGLYATGYVGDMSSIAPENIPFSFVWDLSAVLSHALDDIEAGTYRPTKVYDLGIADGLFHIAINPALRSEIPDAAVEKMEEEIQRIQNGEFEVPFTLEE